MSYNAAELTSTLQHRVCHRCKVHRCSATLHPPSMRSSRVLYNIAFAIAMEFMAILQRHNRCVVVRHRCRAHEHFITLYSTHCRPPSLQSSRTFCNAVANASDVHWTFVKLPSQFHMFHSDIIFINFILILFLFVGKIKIKINTYIYIFIINMYIFILIHTFMYIYIFPLLHHLPLVITKSENYLRYFF
jgi:hypothetical protein